ncbi:imidazole glycerol phosphate synthase, glutamine amidotransferase subunit [Ammonifex degensii KC4]|uniref:Imidazole glycerol phosphate synthase subunit HisH n=1 Tax=Ammonifex degensii (strain DSM 10501 / KC4) TaxID=429009 RepID=C9RB51_AMMDK|nr:imidazole glycerol phosphate synthase, glutamine amidotransferase subunit [Ammonifex degensii KC4]
MILIAVVDYGRGNLRSVAKALETLGFRVEVTAEPKRLKAARGIILPGVGAFAAAVVHLKAQNCWDALREALAEGKPLLGICLGLHLLLSSSEEGEEEEGLGYFPGKVRRLPAGLKVPHMGWNKVELKRPSPLFEGIPDGSWFYFAHSFYAVPEDENSVVAVTDYSFPFAVALERGRVFGVQFHPEKSGERGLKLLENFGRMAESCW